MEFTIFRLVISFPFFRYKFTKIWIYEYYHLLIIAYIYNSNFYFRAQMNNDEYSWLWISNETRAVYVIYNSQESYISVLNWVVDTAHSRAALYLSAFTFYIRR